MIRWQHTLTTTGLSAEFLELKITETAVMAEPRTSRYWSLSEWGHFEGDGAGNASVAGTSAPTLLPK